MKSSMDAVVFLERDRWEFMSVPVPKPAAGDLLIEIEAAGVCHTDLDILAGRYASKLPRIPGHEFSGVVVEVGDRSLEHKLGDRVAVDPLIACGACRNCERKHPNLCLHGEAYGAERDGGFAEYVVVRSENAHGVGAIAATRAALAEPFACVLNALDLAAAEPHQRAAIIGAGPMGLILVAALRARGLTSVAVADRLEARLLRAPDFGATQTAIVDRSLAESFHGQHFDLVIDATGNSEVVQEALGLLADAGTLVPFGVCPPGSQVNIDPYEIYRRQLRIVGSFSLAGGITKAITTLRTSDLPLDQLVTSQFPLNRAEAAFAAIGNPDTIKIQFVPGRQP